MNAAYLPLAAVVAFAGYAGWFVGRTRSAARQNDHSSSSIRRAMGFFLLACIAGLAWPWVQHLSSLGCPSQFEQKGLCSAKLATPSLWAILASGAALSGAVAYVLRRHELLSPLLGTPTNNLHGNKETPALDKGPTPDKAQALVEHKPISLGLAIKKATEGLAEKRLASVFSSTAGRECNRILSEISEQIGATRFSSSALSLVTHDGESGPTSANLDTRHQAELALALAGNAHDAVLLLHTDFDFSDVVIKQLQQIHSICLTDDLDSTIAQACRFSFLAPSAEKRCAILESIKQHINTES